MAQTHDLPYSGRANHYTTDAVDSSYKYVLDEMRNPLSGKKNE